MVVARTVLVVYNRYLSRGGEDEVFEAEVELLRRHDWNVVPVTASPDPSSVLQLTKAATNVVWSIGWHRKIRQLVQIYRPQIVHLHNTFPTMSPAVVHAAREGGAAVVHTLHNYRVVCPNAMCFRDDHPCEDCVGRALAWPGVLHRCYKGSSLLTSGVAASTAVHRLLRTWQEWVDVYISPSSFSRDLLTRGGIPEDKVSVKPNFVLSDPGVGEHDGDFCLFVGRLSSAKGVQTLLRAWANLEIPLKIVGDSPTSQDPVPRFRADAPRVEFLGRASRTETLQMMRESRFLVMPSEWYEVSPLTILEAYACGLPVVASRLGAMTEFVDEGRTGLLFTSADATDLAMKVDWAWRHPEEMTVMGREARRIYESRHTPELNYRILAGIYELAIERRLFSRSRGRRA